MDFEGHLDPARGPDSIASSSPDLLRCLQTGYSNYLPEHAMCRPEVWNRIVIETRSSVASVGERAGLADWYRCGFQNEFVVNCIWKISLVFILSAQAVAFDMEHSSVSRATAQLENAIANYSLG